MMKKTMKKMAALTMAGMMAMSISTGTVSVLLSLIHISEPTRLDVI